jgi:acyl transferase domain-containing protein
MTANEANGTDGQQRLMLEVAYEAMENGELASLRVKTAANIH